jgi:hypothetical protein
MSLLHTLFHLLLNLVLPILLPILPFCAVSTLLLVCGAKPKVQSFLHPHFQFQLNSFFSFAEESQEQEEAKEGEE